MKILNGKLYFEKNDINDIVKLSVSVVDNPYENQDFLLAIQDNERSIVKKSISSLQNSLNWEFISETAINFKKISKVIETLRFNRSDLLTYTEFSSIPVENTKSNDIENYEKWLKNIGLEICEDEFKKIIGI
jgi:hypothetical protein